MNMKKACGFTLIELMFTIVVAIVLVSIAIPSFRSLMANNRSTTQANALFTALNLARSEAIAKNTTVTVCPKSTADVASTICGTNANWANGWQVFTDSGTTGTVDGTDEVLKHWNPLPGTPTLTTTQADIGFIGDGSKRGTGEVTINMSESGTSGEVSRCVRVSTVGMVRVHRITATATCPP